MSEHRLLLGPTGGDVSVRDFVWSAPGQLSSFHTNLSPALVQLGAMPSVARDFCRVAVTVFLVDRTSKRRQAHSDRWARECDLEIPVSDPDLWERVADDLASLVGFLSGDVWSFNFVRETPPVERAPRAEQAPLVSLLSGGADSFCGALASFKLTEGQAVLLSQWDSTVTAGAQRTAAENLGLLLRNTPRHLRVRVGRRKWQLGGEAFGQEPTSRTRSLLFLGLGVAAASARAASLWIPENGFVSLNVPLAPERRGSLSTRTTNAHFLDGLAVLLEDVGIDVEISNPFEAMTKGEVLQSVGADRDHRIAAALGATHSCARSGANYVGFAPSTQCGVCYACIVRRGAFLAAGIVDPTPYIVTQLTGVALRDWLTPQRRLDSETIKYAAEKGFEVADIISLATPARIPIVEALDLARRGLAEIAAVAIP